MAIQKYTYYEEYKNEVGTPKYYLVLLALILWNLFSIYWYVCVIKDNNCNCFGKKKPIASSAPAIAPPKWVVRDAADTLYQTIQNNGLRFLKAQGNYIPSGDVENGLQAIASYLKANPNRQLNLTGYYTTAENNANIGNNRAQSIEQKLLALGVPATQLIKQPAILNNTTLLRNDTVFGGVQFLFKIEQKAIKQLLEKPEDIYFDQGKSAIVMNEKMQQYLKNVRTLLEQDSTKSLLLTGHTDNVGSDADNLKLGLQRAEQVKNALTQTGIHVTKINTTSKGEAEPIKSNDTEEGKAVNRRVQTIVK